MCTNRGFPFLTDVLISTKLRLYLCTCELVYIKYLLKNIKPFYQKILFFFVLYRIIKKLHLKSTTGTSSILQSLLTILSAVTIIAPVSKATSTSLLSTFSAFTRAFG